MTSAGSRDRDGESLPPAALFDLVIARHTAMISRIALAYEADPGPRRELVREIMLAIRRGLPQLRHDSSLKTFVAGIAYRRSISHASRAAARPKSSPPPDGLVGRDPRPGEIESRDRLKKRMLEVIEALPLGQKQAIILCLEDFTFKEIGETMGISTHAAQMRCHRAKAALKAATEKLS